MERKFYKEWLLDQLELVFQHSSELAEVSNELGPSYNSKSILKFAMLAAAVEIYTRIMSKRDEECHYIDALSGAGVMHLKKPDEIISGSPVIVPAVAHEPFEHYHFFERNRKRADALESRLQYVSENTNIELEGNQWTVYPGDSNQKIPDLMNELVDRSMNNDCPNLNLFRFVDNEGRNINWRTIASMAKIWGDFLITFPTKSFPRDVGKIGDEDSDVRETGITNFWGNSTWSDCRTPDDYARLYEDQIADVGYEKYTIRTRVHGAPETRGAYYDLIWATRKTSGDSPYRDGIQHVKNRIEANDGSVVNQFLDAFVRETEGTFELYDTGEGQTGLSEF